MSNALRVTAPEGLPYVEFVREFDAPVEKVFRAHKDPELYKRWVGPRGYEMDLQEYDFSTGGGYRYVHKDGQGGEYAFRGVFHVVRDNDFAIQTFEFEGYPDVVSIESIKFEDLGNGRTRLTGKAVYPTLEARDGMVSSGMEKGMTDGYDQLEELTATL
ncbi:SRPBCC family protein [Leifsonia sp. NPDC058230]|uniref:SRPBCC family protein n=1 Tax=Leifsonia sp. NPDC058230 TaxID=3346391 RepID=UPI0036DB1A15